MKDMFQLWASCVDPTICQEIIDVATEQPPMLAAVGSVGNVVPDYRESDVRFLDRFKTYPDGDGAQWENLYKFVDHYARWANHNAFGTDVNYLQDLQFTTYGETRKDHFRWHRDTFWINPHETGHRKLTIVIQLSDPADYEGGRLELDVENSPDPNLLVQRGTVIVMPAFVWHRVTPVTKGTRHSLVGWMCGPAWR